MIGGAGLTVEIDESMFGESLLIFKKILFFNLDYFFFCKLAGVAGF